MWATEASPLPRKFPRCCAVGGAPGCFRLGGCFWLGASGVAVEQAGAVALAYWGWQRGQHQVAADQAAGRSPRRIRPLAVSALVVASVALVATYVGILYGVFAT